MLITITQNRQNISATLKILMGVVILFAGAQIVIPLKPVPVTFQTIVICLLGLIYSPKLSFFTVLTYILAGAAGMPLFTKFSSGTDYLFATTGGYCLGFLIAAPLMGFISERLPKSFLSLLLCCLIGHIIIYFFGVIWLARFVGLEQAFYNGFVVFIPTGIVKMAIFTYLFSYIKRNKSILK